jgi:ATP-dependent Clp protease ATP-binding subunit ClpA
MKEQTCDYQYLQKGKKFYLCEKGTSPEFGARPLKRVISKYLGRPYCRKRY